MLAFVPWGYFLRRRLDSGKPLSAGERFVVGLICGFICLAGVIFIFAILLGPSDTSLAGRLALSGIPLVAVVVGAVGLWAACSNYLDRALWDLPFWRQKPEKDLEKIGLAPGIREEVFGKTSETKPKEEDEQEAKLVIRSLQTEPLQTARPSLRESPRMSWRKKQLCVLLAVASWITLITAWALLPIHYNPVIGSSNDYTDLGVDWLISYGFAYSVPALAFGAVLFWWFGKSRGRSRR